MKGTGSHRLLDEVSARKIMKFQRWKVIMILKCYLTPWDRIYI